MVKFSIKQKVKLSIKHFFGKCDQMRSLLRIWSHLLKKSLMENFIFCAVWVECFNFPEFQFRILKFDRLDLTNIADFLGSIV